MVADRRPTRRLAYPLKALKARSGVRQVAAILCVSAITLICLYSVQTIRGILASTFPTVTFNLGTAYRDLNYCGSQTLDLYVPSRAGTHPLPLAVFVHGGGMTAGDVVGLTGTACGCVVAAYSFVVLPSRSDDIYAMSIAAVFTLGWVLLLIWADRKPVVSVARLAGAGQVR